MNSRGVPDRVDALHDVVPVRREVGRAGEEAGHPDDRDRLGGTRHRSTAVPAVTAWSRGSVSDGAGASARTRTDEHVVLAGATSLELVDEGAGAGFRWHRLDAALGELAPDPLAGHARGVPRTPAHRDDAARPGAVQPLREGVECAVAGGVVGLARVPEPARRPR